MEVEEKITKKRGWAWFLILLLIAGVMIGIPALCKPMTLSKLREQQTIATRVAVASGVASTALAAVPDDSTTPVANQIADVSKYLIVASVALLMEQFVVEISLYVAIISLVIGVAAYILYKLMKNRALLRISGKMMVFTICISIMVPMGIGIDACLDRVVHTDEMINRVIGTDDEKISEEDMDSEGFLEKITGTFHNVVKKAKNVGNEAERMLMNFIAATAALIITICVVPIITLIMLWNITRWALMDFYRIFLAAE